MSKVWVHDTEIYPNCFVLVSRNVQTNEKKVFQISPIADQRKEMIDHIRDEVETFVGFNSLAYDCPMIHFFITRLYKRFGAKEAVQALKQYSNSLSQHAFERPYLNHVKNPYRRQLDLYTIHHFDNKAKSTSLKVLQFVFKMMNIQETPFDFDKSLKLDQIPQVIEYCSNDVEATHIFFQKAQDAIAFRERMSKIYEIDFTNANDVKIGELILIKTISEKWGVNYEDVMKMRTPFSPIQIKDIIFPYVRFNSEILKIFLGWWRDKTIYETKGQFSEIPLEEVQPILPYCDNTLTKGLLKKLNVIYKGFKFDLGTGGIHGYQVEKKTGIWIADDEYNIDLLDVSSYYPNMAARNNLAPRHFPVAIFVSVIDMLYKQRMEGAKIGDKEIVKAIKLALNGALYGKSNSAYSPMYDPQFMMTICLNGQLLLMMISEKCLDNDVEIIQVNTDGVLIRYHKSKTEIIKDIVQRWMDMTKLKLDLESYQKIVQRDPNNYIGLKTDGKIKRKGVFLINREYHQNHGQLVVAKAIEKYFIEGILPEIFINQHVLADKNLYDFFKLAKLPRTYKLMQRTDFEHVVEYKTKTKRVKKHKVTCIEYEKQLQNTTRYYVANSGYKFVKVMPPLKDKIFDRENRIEAGNLCVEVNNLNTVSTQEVRNNLNIDYYIHETYKIVNAINAGIELELDD